MIHSILIPASAAFCLLASLVCGVFVQDAADPKMMLPIALLSGWLIMSGRLLKISLHDGALLGLLTLWVLWGVSVTISDYPFNSKVTWIIMGTLPLSYMFWRLADFPERWLKLIGIAFLAVGVTLGGWAVIQVTFLKASARWSGRADYPYADPNMLGVHLSLTLLPLLPLILKPSLPRAVSFALATAALALIAGLFATYSRSAMLGCVAGAALTLLLMRHQIIWTKQKLILLGGAVAAALIAFFKTGMINRFKSILSDNGDPDVNGRLSLWHTAFDMSMKNPLTGTGFGTFSSYYPMVRAPADATSAGWWVHMDPLQWAVESGWQTPAVFYALVIFIAVMIWRQAQAKTLSAFQAGCAGGLLCLFLNAHSAYPLHVIPFMIMATGMMFIALPLPVTNSTSWRSPAFAVTLLTALLIILWTGVKAAGTLYLWQDLVIARQSQDEARLNESLQACITHGDPQFAFCKFTLIEKALRSPAITDDQFFKLIEDSRTNNPYLPQPDFYTGLYYLKRGEDGLPQAIESFRQSLFKNPTYWPARKALVTAMVQSGIVYDALKVLEKGADYPVPQHEVGYYNEMRKQLRSMAYGQE